jgi:hypothetical protein
MFENGTGDVVHNISDWRSLMGCMGGSESYTTSSVPCFGFGKVGDIGVNSENHGTGGIADGHC